VPITGYETHIVFQLHNK